MFLTVAAGRQGGKWNTETEALPRRTGLGMVEYGVGVGGGGGGGGVGGGGKGGLRGEARWSGRE